ncbi:DUF6429 family protein [Chiayiivirga flava]|uniref:DUF6429 domain-containing protein n=1 Tax=Chiayiivirga flava TaxID=659595 RepID=A0A7W8D500_9GAMM|nr:DUF6429 family protein [Chiayiivirga flava]MBB5208031.1 hypothetical protein [Chiayiivirga flava]
MQLDDQRIDETVLALLALFSFDGGRSWKGYNWDVMDRLYAQGCIDNPRSNFKSVCLEPQALERGLAIAEQLFSKRPGIGG